jgi:2-succinyl-5-enolpyruvyl-6-hydroxy-3-cyclohexene-1-carboxylate synthase
MNPGTKASVGLSMQPVNRTYAPLQALADELVRCGMTHVVTCPGSRNAPLIYALAETEGLKAVSVLDERSAGFLALGMAKASGRPVAITCTSGTAAANLMPAVVEAYEARVPLIVLTADRPPELRDTGAGQAINQLDLYGSHAKWFVEVGNHEPGRETAVFHRALACRAWATAAGGRPGPVHLNFPLREPLAPRPEELDPADWAGRDGSQPWIQVWEPAASAAAGLATDIAHTRGVLVCGPGTPLGAVEPIAALAEATGWAILAEPTSGLRCGAHDRSHVVAHYDVLLRDERWAEEHLPRIAIRIGDAPTSKPLRAWLARTEQVVLDPHTTWHEPTRSAQWIAAADPALTCADLAETIEVPKNPSWIESWRAADELVPPALADADDPLEPKMWVALATSLPEAATVWVSSSMPIRDVETFFPSLSNPIRFLANRGANGIDGVVSAAAGAALAEGGHAWLLTGELALLHDIGGLLAATRAGAELTIVCANNGGGNIFDFLPLAEHGAGDTFEEHVITPSGIDFAHVAALAGMEHRTASTPDELRAAAAEPGLVEVRTDRAHNVQQHREVYARVAERLSA